MLEVNNLCVYAGKTNIIDSITFNAKYGELTAILALNGIGKTQLLKIISNINPIKEGTVLVDGIKPKYDGKTISYLPQKTELYSDLTCFDYVLMGRTPYISKFGYPSEKDKSIADESIKISGVEHLKERKIYNLSGGEFRRVCIAKLLAQDTRVMLLDEPCAYLDCRRQQKIMYLIRDIVKKDYRCAVVTLHDPSIAFKFCDKVIFIDSYGVVSQLSSKLADLDEINYCLSSIYGNKIKAVKVEDEIVILWGE